MDMPAFAGPDRQRRAPVAFTGQAPVDDVFHKVAHTAVTDVFRQPVDRLGVFHKLIAHGAHLDEPGAARIVQKRGIAAPAERIAVLKFRRVVQLTLCLQRLDDLGVGILDKQAVPRRAAAHLALGIDHLHKRQVVFLAYAIVIFTKGGCVVYDARTVCGGDIIIGNDNMCLLPVQRFDGAVEQRLIGTADQCAAGELIQNLHIFLAQHGGNQIFGEDIDLPVLFGAAVGNAAVDAKADVAGQRPRGGCPGQVIGVLVTALEFCRSRALFYILIALRYLMGGQRRAAAWAIGNDLVPLIQKTLFKDLF